MDNHLFIVDMYHAMHHVPCHAPYPMPCNMLAVAKQYIVYYNLYELMQ